MILFAPQHILWATLLSAVAVANRLSPAPTPHNGLTHGATVIGGASDASTWKCHVYPLVEGLNRSDQNPIAVGSYHDAINSTGWGTLNISTRAQPLHRRKYTHMSETESQQRMFAAGCLEAYFTHTRMMQYWKNYAKMEYGSPGKPSPALVTFMSSQLAFARNLVASHSPYVDSTVHPLHGLQLLLAQFDGLAEGFSAYASQAEKQWLPDALHIYLLNSVGDLETLNGLFKNHEDSKSAAQNTATTRAGYQGQSPLARLDCSALIQVVTNPATGMPQDIYAGHTTWRAFYAMLRIYKTYAFVDYPAAVISIASSPGM